MTAFTVSTTAFDLMRQSAIPPPKPVVEAQQLFEWSIPETWRLTGLPTLWMSLVKPKMDGTVLDLSGSALARKATHAEIVAKAESVERACMNYVEQSTLPALAGRAIHASRTFARDHAYREWVERVAVSGVATGTTRLALLPPLTVPIDIRIWMRLNRYRLSAYHLAASPHAVLIAATRTDATGVVFGSGAATSLPAAWNKALMEALRMAYIVPTIAHSNSETDFTRHLRHWFSKTGVGKFAKYVGHALAVCPSERMQFTFKEDFVTEYWVKGHGWYCTYWDPAYDLGEPNDQLTPLM